VSTDLIVTTRHLFTIPGFSCRPGFCRDSSRAWFRRQGMDWQAFVRDGINAQRLEATGDGLALALVKWARQCESEATTHGR